MFQNHKRGHMFSFITGKVLGVFIMNIFALYIQCPYSLLYVHCWAKMSFLSITFFYRTIYLLILNRFLIHLNLKQRWKSICCQVDWLSDFDINDSWLWLSWGQHAISQATVHFGSIIINGCNFFFQFLFFSSFCFCYNHLLCYYSL